MIKTSCIPLYRARYYQVSRLDVPQTDARALQRSAICVTGQLVTWLRAYVGMDG